MIRTIIADDHELIREGIKKTVHLARDIRVVAEAADLAEAVQRVAQHAPDVLVLDLALPGYQGLEALAAIAGEYPDLPILVLSMFPEERFAIGALKQGAAGYINKAETAKDLVGAIRKVAGSGAYISPRVAELLAFDSREIHPHERLSEREMQIASLFGSGKQVKQIAAELSISVSSVNTYRSRILGKLGLRSNAELIRYVIEHQLSA